MNLEDIGNTVSSIVMIGQKGRMKNGTILLGMKEMCAGFGVGWSWGGLALKF